MYFLHKDDEFSIQKNMNKIIKLDENILIKNMQEISEKPELKKKKKKKMKKRRNIFKKKENYNEIIEISDSDENINNEIIKEEKILTILSENSGLIINFNKNSMEIVFYIKFIS